MTSTKRHNFSKRSRGLTLIEVMAGLAIMGSLAVGLVLSRGKLLEQQQRALQTKQAVQLAGTLLNQWHQDSWAMLPLDTTGDFDDLPHWHWETQTIDSPQLTEFNTQKVRLTIYAPPNPASNNLPQPATTIEILTPIPEPGDGTPATTNAISQRHNQ